MEEAATADGVCEISVSFNILYEKKKVPYSQSIPKTS